MSQDQGPIQEPQVSKIDQALQAHNFDDLVERTNDLDGSVKMSINNTGFDLNVLMKKWKGSEDWKELKGKKVLDLAAGSALGKLQWQPYFARLCAFNGASVTAVDQLAQIGPDVKLFRGIRADLVSAVMERKLAQVVEQGEYDVIHSYSFIGINPSPELVEKLSKLKINEEDFRQHLFEQSFDLLAEGGIMYLDEHDNIKNEDIYYTKKEGKPVRV